MKGERKCNKVNLTYFLFIGGIPETQEDADAAAAEAGEITF